MADEYMPNALGCAGHSTVLTPHLDELAESGVRFSNAYSPSPMCVPARAAFQTGQHVDKIRCWSSAEPYDGKPQGWGHHLRRSGVHVSSIGKLHFKSSETDNGFDPELLPLHVTDGEGWVPGLLRKNPLPFDSYNYANHIGSGDSDYTLYDERIANEACSRLSATPRQPWVLFVSLVSPHYPLIAPNRFFNYYDPLRVDMPFCYEQSERSTHPVVRKVMEASGYDQHFDEEKVRVARASYYGLCSYVDDIVGRLMKTLRQQNLIDSTRIIFTSDHGEMLGNHGAWTKMLMFEDSVGIPMILSGPGIDQGKENKTPVTLLDIPPMLYEDHQCEVGETALDGESLATLSKQDQSNRCILSQYHDGWSPTGYYMTRWDNWKYICYQDYEPQLFDLDNDPQERKDLAGKPGFRKICQEGSDRLHGFLDPQAVNSQSFADQEKLIEFYGRESGIKDKMELYFDYTPLSGETR